MLACLDLPTLALSSIQRPQLHAGHVLISITSNMAWLQEVAYTETACAQTVRHAIACRETAHDDSTDTEHA